MCRVTTVFIIMTVVLDVFVWDLEKVVMVRTGWGDKEKGQRSKA